MPTEDIEPVKEEKERIISANEAYLLDLIAEIIVELILKEEE
jgi:hypothetical protein